MMMRGLAAGVAASVLFATAAVAKTEPAAMLTEVDSGTVVHLPVGARLQLRLKANRTTGYDWKMVSRSPKLKLVEDDYVTSPKRKSRWRAAGQGGVRVFTLQARQPGVAPLRLRYARPWLKRDPNARSFLARVVIAAK